MNKFLNSSQTYREGGIMNKFLTACSLSLSLAFALTGLAACGERDPHSKYDLEVSDFGQVVVGEQKNVDVTLKATDIREEGYDKVLIMVDVSDKDNLMLKATDAQSQEWDVSQIGYWGPPTGFPIAADYEVTTTFRATALKAGDYTVKLRLVNLDDENNTLASKTVTFKAVEA